jgi:hypothetical protein
LTHTIDVTRSRKETDYSKMHLHIYRKNI